MCYLFIIDKLQNVPHLHEINPNRALGLLINYSMKIITNSIVHRQFWDSDIRSNSLEISYTLRGSKIHCMRSQSLSRAKWIQFPFRPTSHMLFLPFRFPDEISNYTWRRVQVMKFLNMQFSPVVHHSISLRSKYSPQHPESMFLP
jgi:hypothetical protein